MARNSLPVADGDVTYGPNRVPGLRAMICRRRGSGHSTPKRSPVPAAGTEVPRVRRGTPGHRVVVPDGFPGGVLGVVAYLQSCTVSYRYSCDAGRLPCDILTEISVCSGGYEGPTAGRCFRSSRPAKSTSAPGADHSILIQAGTKTERSTTRATAGSPCGKSADSPLKRSRALNTG